MLCTLAALLLTILPTTPPPPSVPDKPAAEAPKDDPPEEKQNLILPDGAEVRLDGKLVKFADVPAGCRVINLDVAADKRTILRIWFSSKPKE